MNLKNNPNICSLQEAYFKYNNIRSFKAKIWKKYNM